MAGKELKIRKLPRYTRISTILWMSFTLILLLVVAALSFGQYTLLSQAYLEQTRTDLIAQCRSIYNDLNDKENLAPNAVSSYLINIIVSSGSSVYIFDGDGEVLYPILSVSEEESEDFSELVSSLKSKIEQYTDGTPGSSVGFRSGDEYCIVLVMRMDNQIVYLYMSSPVTVSETVQTAMIVQIVFVGLVVIILSFFVVAIISSRISGPIADISEKAKRLGKGDFDVDFNTTLDSCTEIHELTETLNRTRDELSKADQMQKELLANVTHDFKTPLTMIKAYASMIQEISGDDPEKRNKHCQVIIDESDRLASLVNDILEISKIRAGINTLKTCVFNLSEYTETIADRFSYLEVTQGYTIKTDIREDLYTEADKEKIGQVIYNLIGNAVNYTGADKTIFVRLAESGGCIRFDVTDTGSGIKKEEIDTIWDRYYRSSEAHKRPIKGTGLGLSIVKTILTKHNFNFGVISEVGKGSTFYVDFPQRTVWNIEASEGKEGGERSDGEA